MVVSLPLWRVFISPAYVWTLLCADKTERSTEGPVPAQVHRRPHRESHCLASDSLLTRSSPHPQIWSSPNPYEVTAASKADFQPAQRHPGPSPQPGLPRSEYRAGVGFRALQSAALPSGILGTPLSLLLFPPLNPPPQKDEASLPFFFFFLSNRSCIFTVFYFMPATLPTALGIFRPFSLGQAHCPGRDVREEVGSWREGHFALKSNFLQCLFRLDARCSLGFSESF